MIAEILSIGDELLIGQVVNTNQAYIAEHLNRVGISVARMTTVGDDRGSILAAFRLAWDRSDVLTVTGGLGPTHDDITREAVCAFFGRRLVLHQQTLDHVRALLAQRNVTPLKRNEDQALVPDGCTVIPNPIGTAPGYLFEDAGKVMFVMPGVPYEMKAMMEATVIPFLAAKGSDHVVRHRTLKTTGIAESILAERIGDINALLRNDEGLTLAFLPSPRGVRLRVTARRRSSADAEALISRVEEEIRARAGKYIYGVDDEEIEEVVGRLLTERGLTIAIAESCTGGLIADRLTDVPGSSAYVERGFITYSNSSKVEELGIDPRLIAEHGAVSRPVAEAMALGARERTKTDIGISTTGIAGPAGGSQAKPVGLVWIGYSDAHETFAIEFRFAEGRRRVKERASQAALEIVRRRLLGVEQLFSTAGKKTGTP